MVVIIMTVSIDLDEDESKKHGLILTRDNEV